MWPILIVEFIICIIFALLLYKNYGSYTKRPFYVTILTLMGWILCFYIVFLVPNDVSQAAQCNVSHCDTKTNNTSPYTNNYDGNQDPEDCTGVVIVPFTVLVWLWRVVYWVTLCATWGAFPIAQTYSQTGQFSFGEKMRMSIKSNLLLYAIMGTVLAVIGLIYILESGVKWSSVSGTAMAAANAYGLFMIIAMLGHGLVNVPRGMWNSANLPLTLKKLQFEVADYDNKLHDAQLHLNKTLKKIRKASEITNEDDAFRKYIDKIISKCPKEFESILFGEGNIEISYKSLASLHEKLMREDHAVQLYDSLLKNTLKRAIFLEDVINSIGSSDYKIKWSFKEQRITKLGKILDHIEYFWFCYIKKRVLQLFTIFCVFISMIVVWSELLFFVCKIDLSVFSLYIRAIRLSPPFILQVAIILPVLYIALCIYSSLFRLRLFNYYHIAPHSKSDSNSLLFSAAYLCRLTSPMAYNFMQMSHYKNTAFVVVIGELDSNWSNYFQEFFPIILLPFILMTLFNVYSKILSLLHIKRFQFDEDFNDQLIDDGKEIMEDEKERQRREMNREIELETVETPSNKSTPSSQPSFSSVENHRRHHHHSNDIDIEDLPIDDEPQVILSNSNSFLQRIKNVFTRKPPTPKPITSISSDDVFSG